MLVDIIENREKAEEYYYRLEKGDKIAFKYSKNDYIIAEIIDEPPKCMSISYFRSIRFVKKINNKNITCECYFDCIYMIYNEHIQNLDIGYYKKLSSLFIHNK